MFVEEFFPHFGVFDVEVHADGEVEELNVGVDVFFADEAVDVFQGTNWVVLFGVHVGAGFAAHAGTLADFALEEEHFARHWLPELD